MIEQLVVATTEMRNPRPSGIVLWTACLALCSMYEYSLADKSYSTCQAVNLEF
jgi:hypothetical protein